MFWKKEEGNSALKQRNGLGAIKSILFGLGAGEKRSFTGENGARLPVHLRPVTIATMNQKGGCGKTTTVVNLSAALAEQGYRVLVIDMDPQAHASLGLGVGNQELRRSIRDLMLDRNVTFGDVMRQTAIASLEILPGSIELASAQMELANFPRGEAVLKRVLASVEERYDFIFIDCPPTLNLLTLNALTYARRVLIPIQTHYYALEGMKELFKTIDAVRSRFNADLEVLGILATLFDKRVGIANDMLQELRNHFGTAMFETVIHSNVKLIEAPMVQKPVTVYAPQSRSAKDFVHLAEEVVRLVVK